METDSRSSIYAIMVGTFVFGMIYFLNNVRNCHKFFEVRGVRTPKPIFLLGHLHMALTKHFADLTVEWAANYGRVTGVFLGWTPRVLVADAETMNQICVRDFEAFTDHFGIGLMDKHLRKSVFFQQGDRWRKIRALISPNFTSTKIRNMYSLIDACADDLVMLFCQQLNDSKDSDSAIVNIEDLFTLYTIDTIASCCYGMKMEQSRGLNIQRTVSDRIKALRLCLPTLTISWVRMIVCWIVPKWILKLTNYTSFDAKRIGSWIKSNSEILKTRHRATKKYNDYLQMLIDSRLNDAMNLDQVDQAENHHAGLSHESLKADQKQLVDRVMQNHKRTIVNGQEVKLTEMEIVSNATFLMVAGIESTDKFLTACLYGLAHHPTIQERLYQELKPIAERRKDTGTFEFDYEKLTTNKYLDAIISESLRLNPIVHTADRRVNRDYHFDKWNFSIPKDSVLLIGLYALQHDPEYWPEPYKFDPERFMPENRDKIVPGSYCPFGIGPRHCVGMRFSLTESKLAIAKVIMNFRFESMPGQTFPGQLAMTMEALSIKDSQIIVKFR